MVRTRSTCRPLMWKLVYEKTDLGGPESWGTRRPEMNVLRTKTSSVTLFRHFVDLMHLLSSGFVSIYKPTNFPVPRLKGEFRIYGNYKSFVSFHTFSASQRQRPYRIQTGTIFWAIQQFLTNMIKFSLFSNDLMEFLQ